MRRLTALLAAVLVGATMILVATTPAFATTRYVDYNNRVIVSGGLSVANNVTTWNLTFRPNQFTFPDRQCAHLRLEIDKQYWFDPAWDSAPICSRSEAEAEVLALLTDSLPMREWQSAELLARVLVQWHGSRPVDEHVTGLTGVDGGGT